MLSFTSKYFTFTSQTWQADVVFLSAKTVRCGQKMRAAGVNMFPAEDSFKYVKILDKVK